VLDIPPHKAEVKGAGATVDNPWNEGRRRGSLVRVTSIDMSEDLPSAQSQLKKHSQAHSKASFISTREEVLLDNGRVAASRRA
jgi:hypothetical protein